MPTATDKIVLPLCVVDWTRKYTDSIRVVVERHLVERLQREGRREVTIADMQACIGLAFTEHHEKLIEPEADLETLSTAIKQIEAGQSRPAREFLNELRR